MVNAEAYVEKCRLCIIGVYRSPWGSLPFSYRCELPRGEGIPEGPVNIGDENTHPEIVKAIDESQGEIMARIKKDSMTVAAADLVQRARQGDQNAMAMIVMVRKEAKRGSKRARRAHGILKAYIQKHPSSSVGVEEKIKSNLQELKVAKIVNSLDKSIQTNSPRKYSAAVLTHVPEIATADLRSIYVCACTLANGPILLSKQGPNPRIMAMQEALRDPRLRKSFLYGMQNANEKSSKKIAETLEGLPTEAKEAVLTGQSVGLARKIQAVRLPNTPISNFSSMAGWELGE